MRAPFRLLWGLPALLALALGVVAVTAWLPVPPLPPPGLRPAPAPAPLPGITSGTALSGEPATSGAGESLSAEGTQGIEGTPGPGGASDGAPGAVVADAPPAAPEGGLLSALAPVRVPRPGAPPGPRRIGIQAGHWLTAEVPEELRRLEHSTG